jgi:hypothetical protein
MQSLIEAAILFTYCVAEKGQAQKIHANRSGVFIQTIFFATTPS